MDKNFNGVNWFTYRQNVLKSGQLKTREQTYDAIRDMLAQLGDPFTRFLTPEAYATMSSSTTGSVSGVGLEMTFKDDSGEGESSGSGLKAGEGVLTVVAPVAGGPAAEAGIESGDVVTSIGGQSTAGLSLYEIAQRLQGAPGSKVSVGVIKDGTSAPVELDVERRVITLEPVRSALCGPEVTTDKGERVGYIGLSTFNSKSADAFESALKGLKEEGAHAFIVDLRNNSGGLFPAAVQIADELMPGGVVVYISDSVGVKDVYEAEDSGMPTAEKPQDPVVVLVNRGTASASEVLAGALKDNHRALILGEGTFGKGLIQSLVPLADGSAVAVTVARYQTPSLRDINKVGIMPDGPEPPELDFVVADGPSKVCAALEGAPATAPRIFDGAPRMFEPAEGDEFDELDFTL